MDNKFIGMEFGVNFGKGTIIIKIPKDKYDHFAYRPDMSMVGCFDQFNGIVWATPLDKVVYIKNMEEGKW